MKNKYVTIGLLVLVGCLFGFIIYNQSKITKNVYIENGALFDGFSMKLELEKKFKNTESIKTQMLDSIYNEIKLKVQIADPKEENNIMLLKKEYMYKKKNFENENDEMMKSFNEQIWSQLNEYTKEFAILNNYDFLFGANGQGGLMYSKENHNVTKELIEFVNAKYSGSHK